MLSLLQKCPSASEAARKARDPTSVHVRAESTGAPAWPDWMLEAQGDPQRVHIRKDFVTRQVA